MPKRLAAFGQEIPSRRAVSRICWRSASVYRVLRPRLGFEEPFALADDFGVVGFDLRRAMSASP